MTNAETLCGFCPPNNRPNIANTTIQVASGHEYPICTDCLMDFHESLYNEWLSQSIAEDLSDPSFNSHPAAMGRMP